MKTICGRPPGGYSGIYITQNEFNRAALIDYNSMIFKGSQIYAISMSQLKSLQPAPYFVHYGGMTIGGMTADALYPALTQTPAPAEFFTSSLYRGSLSSSCAPGGGNAKSCFLP